MKYAFESVPLEQAKDGLAAGTIDCYISPVGAYLRSTGLKYDLIKSIPLMLGISPDIV